MKKRERKVVEPCKLVACLPGYENKDAGIMSKRLRKVFYHKSGTELRLEQSQKIKLITYG